MAGHLGVGRGLSQGADEEAGHAHGRRAYRPPRTRPGGGRGRLGGRPPVSRRLLVAEPLADQLDLGLGGVGVGALGIEQGPPVGLGLGLGPGVGRGQAGLDPLGHQPLGLGDQRLDHLVLGDDPDDLALDEQVAPLAARRRCPRSASRASPGPLTTQPMTATWMGRFRSSSASWAALATAITSISARPQLTGRR